MQFYLTAIGSALLYAVGSIYMLRSQGITQFLPSLLMYSLYIGGATLQAIATGEVASVGIAYTFILGLEATITPVIAVIWLREHYSLSQWFGIFLVVCGIILIRNVKL